MKPNISVLIPAYNEESFISKCLESVKSQSYPVDRYEIIVMDNGSTDRTKEIAESMGVRVLNAEGLSIGGVRNLGAEVAEGEIFAYIDADCIAQPNWLFNGSEFLSGVSNVAAVGGRCFLPNNSTWVQRAWGWKEVHAGTQSVDILSTGSFFVKRDAFFRVGGFNPRLVAGEDTEISRKLKEEGVSLLLSSAVGVVHLGYPSSIREFCARQIWQSTDYLSSTKKIIDPVFVMVHLFSIFIFISAFSILFQKTRNGAMLFFGATVIIAIALTLFRHIKLKRKLEVVMFLQYAFLNYLYLASRSIGLIKSYFRSFIGKS